jgi:mannose-6-phosphate isomerase-like protein (cupin superfamily)
MENGKSQPSVATLYSLSQLLGTSIDALFHDSGDAPTTVSVEAVPDVDEPADEDAGAGQDGTAAFRAPSVGAVLSARVNRSTLGSPADAFERGNRRTRWSLVRPHERPRIVMDSGVVWEQLAANTGDDLDFIEIIYPPHGSSTTDDRMLQHAGFECGFLLEGELEITIGFDTFTMRPGDSVGFDSAIPHIFRNLGEIPARGVWYVRHAH